MGETPGPSALTADDEAGSVACVRCGAVIPRALATFTSVSLTAEGPLGDPVCGLDCQTTKLVDHLARPRCPGWECKGLVDTASGPGRPRVYCDDACRKRTDAVLRRALVRLAKGRGAEHVSGSAADQVEKLTVLLGEQWFLMRCWQGRPGELIDGRPYPPPPMQPEKPMRQQLARQIDRLKSARVFAMEALRSEQAEAAAAARRAQEQAVRRGRTARDRGWRQRVLGRLGAAGADATDQRVAQEQADREQDQNLGVY